MGDYDGRMGRALPDLVHLPATDPSSFANPRMPNDDHPHPSMILQAQVISRGQAEAH